MYLHVNSILSCGLGFFFNNQVTKLIILDSLELFLVFLEKLHLCTLSKWVQKEQNYVIRHLQNVSNLLLNAMKNIIFTKIFYHKVML